jgi:hypothetical protein
MKRDVLLEASRDLEYIGALPARFFDAGAGSDREPIDCAVDLIEELVDMGLCHLATWSPKGVASKTIVIQRTRAELAAHLAEMESDSLHVFEWFLLATSLGDEWVRRYLSLVGELDPPDVIATAPESGLA